MSNFERRHPGNASCLTIWGQALSITESAKQKNSNFGELANHPNSSPFSVLFFPHLKAFENQLDGKHSSENLKIEGLLVFFRPKEGK